VVPTTGSPNHKEDQPRQGRQLRAGPGNSVPVRHSAAPCRGGSVVRAFRWLLPPA